MRILLHILIVLEMIFVNLTTVHICSKRRRSLPCIAASLAVCTALIVGGTLFLLLGDKKLRKRQRPVRAGRFFVYASAGMALSKNLSLVYSPPSVPPGSTPC